MRFHVVGLPHTHVTEDFSACAFTMKVMNFCRMMKERGHTVFLYAGEQNEALCDEHIPCISEKQRQRIVGKLHYTEPAWDIDNDGWKVFITTAIAEIRGRIEEKDFVCIIGGYAHHQIVNAFPAHISVEIGVGYGGCFHKHKVFESHAWRHTIYGARTHNNPTAADGNWYDEVIPGYLDPDKFPFRDEKDDYFLYVGRLIDRKGYAIAQKVCETLGKRLILAGPGEQIGYGEFVGTVGPEERGRLMSGAKALFAPTWYLEPFGNVAVEAQACGTPVICTNWGAFTETVIDRVTGFRCRDLAEFLWAAQSTEGLNPYVIRNHAISNYSLDVIGKKYEDYFLRLMNLWDEGWTLPDVERYGPFMDTAEWRIDLLNGKYGHLL